MAVIKPFRGVRYNSARIEDMHTVVSQPYDRISQELQAQYHALSPYNITRIIQGHLEDVGVPDPPNWNDNDVYTRARIHYQRWLQEGILCREAQPAIYVYEQRFQVGRHTYTRTGMIAALELTNFDEGVVLPHERTHSGPKADRLQLMRTLQVNPEPIFILYPDAENRVNALLRKTTSHRQPDVDTVELFEDGVRQRLWTVTDPEVLAAIQTEMAPMRHLIIADGHHRYETALTYRNEQRRRYPFLPANAAVNYVSALLVSMDDPGLVVLPTHREIRNLNDTDPQTILQRARPYFHISPAADLDSCLHTINQQPEGHAFGFYGGQATGFHTLTLKDTVSLDTLINSTHSREWKSLSVSIVHKLLLEKIAEVPAQGIEDKSLVRYHRSADDAVTSVDAGTGNFVFFLSPTRMRHIRAVAGKGEKMPQKSTDFYPKAISGLVMLPVGVDECL